MTTKKQVLSLFENKRGQNISGEHIAEQLGVSRNAVWKAVKELEKDGYRINAVTNKGYCFSPDNDILSVEGILPFLEKKHSQIIVHNTLESTNKTAKEMAISEAVHGTVIIANHQTAGKGRFGRPFFSPAGHGIYMSFILRPDALWLTTPTLITAFAAVAVCEAIEIVCKCKNPPQIKWVNDIFLNGKKICGILTEAVTDFESSTIDWVVVGIGINFSTPNEGVPEALNDIAGAIFSGDSPTTTRNHLIGEVMNRMMTVCKCENSQSEDEQSEAPDHERELLKKYKARLLMMGKKITVIESTQTYEAIAVDIDDIGRLVVKKNDGELAVLSSGEISVKLSPNKI